MASRASSSSAAFVFAMLVLYWHASVSASDEFDGHGTAASSWSNVSLPVPCAACRDNGTCEHAFDGRPGHFCHTVDWSGLLCCCPRDAECVNSRPSHCACDDPIGDDRGLDAAGYFFLVNFFVLFFAMVVLMVGAMCRNCYYLAQSVRCSRRRHTAGGVHQLIVTTHHSSTKYGSSTTINGNAGGGGSFAGDS